MIKIEGLSSDMAADNIEPSEPTHHRELPKDKIKYRNISQHRLSAEMGV